MPGRPNLSIGPVLPRGSERTYRFLDYFVGADVDEAWLADYLALDEQVGAEDRALVEGVQRGISSGALEHGTLLPESEQLIAWFQASVVRRARRRARLTTRDRCPTPSRTPAIAARAWHHLPVTTVTEPAQSRLINRELSAVEFYARVLELAEDDDAPAPRARQVRRDLRAVHRRVLHDPRRRAARAGGVRDARFARRTGWRRARRSRAIRERVDELAGRQAKLWKRELRPALAAAGLEIATVDECSGQRARRSSAGTSSARSIPILTPLAVGPGQPFPYVSGLSMSLGVIARRPRHRRGALRAREGAGGARALRRGRQEARAARGRDRALPADALPGDGDHRARALPRHARRRLRGLRRRRRPARGRRDGASAAALRRRRPARGLELRLAGDARPAHGRARRAAEPGLRGGGPPRPGRPVAARRARPARPQARPLDARRPAPLGAREDARAASSRRSAAAT